MRNHDKGGMQTSGVKCSIICPKCSKDAARMTTGEGEIAYMHYTKMGCMWHVQSLSTGEWHREKTRKETTKHEGN